MYKVDSTTNTIKKVESNSFSKLGIKERENLQEWLEKNSESLGEELLFIQKEFDGFNDTCERLDLLAIDKLGNLVIIENKLDDSGKDVTWQALKYASYCSSLTKHQIKDIFQSYLNKKGIQVDSETLLNNFLEIEDLDEIELNQTQRIILVSGSYRKEVTSTVMWLLTNYNLKIQCFKVTPYTFNEEIFINIEQIIPVKEAEEYTIKMAEKTKENHATQQQTNKRHKFRYEYWQQLIKKLNENSKYFSNLSPSKNIAIKMGAGLGGVGFHFVVSQKYARTEVYISRPNANENKFIFDELLKQKNKIEAVTGVLEWERLNEGKSSRIKQELNDVSLYEKKDWEQMINFMVESMSTLQAAFKNPLINIGIELKEKL